MSRGLPNLLAFLPGNPAIVHPLVALTIVGVLFLIADGIAHIAAPRLRRRARPLGEALAGHFRPILRHSLGSGLFALTVMLWPIGAVAHLILGAAFALSVALLAVHILRSLAIPRWAVVPLALLLFVMILSGSSGGFAPVADMLDGIGIDLGKRRITLLGLVSTAAIFLR